ncbi:glycoside hydrolase family 79 protein [Whalleya microplaca]|nr:glycoside hydrolase family 79 protein [Whalleya microplaca]
MLYQSSKQTPILLGLAGLGLTATLPRDASSLSLNIPAGNAIDKSDTINSAFCGFAFEQASFVRYAQGDDGKPNAFSKNLIEAIVSRTKGFPIIRLGGTSTDYAKYQPGQKKPALPVDEQDKYQNIGFETIGPSYWELAHNFPDAKYMVQVPLATTNVSETIAWTESAVKGIGLANIYTIQPGNEPDLYANNFKGKDGVKLQPPEYQGTLNAETYAGNYSKYVEKILDKLPNLGKGRKFSAFDVSTHFGKAEGEEATVLDVGECFSLGIDKSNAIHEVAHHYYQGNAGGAADLASGLMDVGATHHHLDQFAKRISWLRQNKPDIKFVLSEVGNSLDRTNAYAYQARLGSALWQLDFYLYAMTVGVARINYQQIMHAGYNLWLPVASAGHQPQVFANFYSQPFVADFIGTSGKTRVAQLKTGRKDNVAAYAAYEGSDGAAKRLAVANLNYWNKATAGGKERPGVAVDLKVGKDVKKVRVVRLSSPEGAGAEADSITYGGSQWTYKSLGKEVKGVRDDTKEITVKDGVARVTVPSSEAVLVELS